MDIKDFKAGTYRKQRGYKSFLPTEVNSEWVVSSPEINCLLEDANRLIGELNAFSQYIPDVDFFIMMHVVKEATTSSRIEGTQTSIEDVLLDEESVNPEKKDDWIEVQNYIKATNDAINRLSELPLSNRLIRDTHKILLSGVRGQHKLPGEFRRSQNWIGGASLKDAIFIPPHHHELDELMSDLEKFINDYEINVPNLIKIGIAHYQFETIHPFLDGNGRIGRLLITLYLIANKILAKPTLYLSDFFERNRALYYDNLMVVRTSDNLSQWLKFFLVGITETARKSIDTFKAILALKETIESKEIITLGKKLPTARKFVDELYKDPVMSAAGAKEKLGVTLPTVNSLISDFVRLGILTEITGFKRNRLFAFTRYISLFH